MTATGQQIKAAFEQEGKTPEFIATDLGLSVEAVKAYLSQHSTKFREECKTEAPERVDLNFSDDQLAKVNEVIYDCALSAELPDGTPDYRTRLKAAQYIRDDKKKRLDHVKALHNGPVQNVFMLNEAIQNARLGAGAARRLIEEPSINVEEVA